MFKAMTYHFDADEFTSWELLEYLKCVYGKQINGAPFTSTNLNNWIRQKKIADLYGGYKIIKTTRYKELGNLLVLTLERFRREDMQAFVGSALENMQETVNRKRKVDVIPKSTRARKQRTRLYYQLLPKSKQYTKYTLQEATLHDYWRDAGGKNNQLVKGRKRKPRKSN